MQPLRWYANRLRAMSVAEMAARSRRRIRHALERAGWLRADRAPVPTRMPTPGFTLPIPALLDAGAYVAEAARAGEGRFGFFGEEFSWPRGPAWNVDPKTGVEAPLTFGKTLDYRDTRLVGDIKYLWELNRHLELVPLAQAYALTGDASHLHTLRRLLSSWLEQCPYPRGPNWCSSLELAIRLINWHFVYLLAGGAESPLFAGEEGRRFAADWLRSIYQHVHFIMGHLSSHSSANNHVIGELAGAYVAASTWDCWPEMAEWRARARAGLCEQIERQTHSDGVNKEQAVWYQQFVMYFFVVAGLVGERSGAAFPAEYWRQLRRMTGFIDALMDVGGHMPMIGDADDGIVFALEPKERFEPFRSMLAIGGRLFDEPRWRQRGAGHEGTAEWLCAGLPPVLPAEEAAPAQRDFAAGGYYVLGRRLGEPDEVRLVADAAPLGFLSIAAHGHADCLAFTLSVGGRELLVDPGTYSYHTQHDWRDYFRGTAAHNTARVDGIDQSEIAGPFLWGYKAEPVVEAFRSSADLDYLRAKHLGYRRLSDPLTHVRTISFDKRTGTIQVDDEFECRGPHRIERFWHFAEDCAVEVAGSRIQARSGSSALALEPLDARADLRLRRGELAPIGGWVSRSFGRKTPATTAVVTTGIDGACTLRTRIVLGAG